MKTKNNSRQQWLEFALQQLVEHGPQQLTIAKLCAVKGVTKGSFYHHFKNRQLFIKALMEHWYQEKTLNFIEQANMEEGPLQRLEKLDKVIANHDLEAEMHIRAWALQEPMIVGHLEKIDSQRQSYLQQCYVEMQVPVELAQDIAMIAYAQFLGMQQLYPKPDFATVSRMAELAASKFFEDIS